MLFVASVVLLPSRLFATPATEDVIKPWTFVEEKHGDCGNKENDLFPYIGLNNSGEKYWGRFENSGLYGYGGQCEKKEHKFLSISIYKFERVVRPYTKEEYQYEIGLQTASYARVLSSVYAFETLSEAENTYLDLAAYKCPAGGSTYTPSSGMLISSVFNDDVSGTAKMKYVTMNVTFDNSGNTKSKTFTKYLVLAISVDNYNDKKKYGWGAFKVTAKGEKKTFPLSGDGTSSKPYLITSAKDLEIFRDLANDGQPDACGKLTNDIDMSGKEWRPIGRCSNECNVSFTGSFDGDGFVIKNLSGESKTDDDMALIGRTGGGVVKNVIIENCNLTGKYRGAAIVGYVYGSATIENCGSFGDIKVQKSEPTWTQGTGGIIGYSEVQVTLKNCISTIELNNSNGQVSMSDCCENVTNKQLECGEACYKVNGNQAVYPIWYQTIGTDKYPRPQAGKAVHKTGDVYHNDELPFGGSGSVADPFQLSSAEHLQMFAKLVSYGYQNICAILVSDIDYSKCSDIADMIGTEEYPFSGTFNGNKMNLTIGFKVDQDLAALFRYTKDAMIANFHIKGSITSSGRIMAPVVGQAAGSLVLCNVMNSVNILSSVNGDASSSSMVALADANSELTITNCAFVGRFLGPDATCNGGFIGWMRSKANVTIQSSYISPAETTIKLDNDSYTFVRYSTKNNNKISLSNNCYYTKALGTPQGNIVSEEQMKSGALCFWLNGSTNVNADWLQTLGTDSRPVLWGANRVYYQGGIYANYEAPLPGAGTQSDPYIIATPKDLETFRDMVNAGQISICGRLAADIDMKDRFWTPIGRWTISETYKLRYIGVFDGDGFIISNLSGHDTDDYNMGLIGVAGDGCVVKDVIMNNVHLEAQYRAAPIIGLISEDADVKVRNCGVFGLVRLVYSKTSSVGTGGLVCVDQNFKGTIENCYTTYSNVYGYKSCTPVNCYCGKDVEKMAATGELCYKLNAKDGNYLWRQTIGTHPYPLQRTGKKVYYDKNTGAYTNFQVNDNDNYPFADNVSSDDFHVYHHGGRLYEFVATLGTNDGQGWHAYPAMKLSYQIDGTWYECAELDSINREGLEFEEDWSGQIKPLAGTFINTRTFEKQTAVFWILQGNHTSRKQTSLFWLLPEDVNASVTEFLLEDVKKTGLRMTTVIEKPIQPSGQNSITANDPYLDAANKIAGSQAFVMVATQPVYSLGFWDATDNEFISAREYSEGTQSITASLPPVESLHNVEALMYGQHVETASDGASDTTFVTYTVPIRLKPSHSILRVKAAKNYNHQTRLEWAINCPTDSDAMDGDKFIVYRATKSDFSDAKTIGGLGLMEFSSLSEENDSTFGWYCFADSTKEALSTAERYSGEQSVFDDWNLPSGAQTILNSYKYPARYLYYKVNRSIFNGIWGEIGRYFKTWKVLLTEVLPTVSQVKVNKTDNWEKTHKVTLRLTLSNPYPWDAVDAADRDAVRAEANNQGFASRMFAWDEKAKIKIRRYSYEDEWFNGKDEIAKDIVVSGKDVKQDVSGDYYVEVSDIQSVPSTHYYYEAIVDNSESNYPISESKNLKVSSSKEDADACYSEDIVAVSNFKATKCESPGQVSISWDADGGSNNKFKLERRNYKYAYKSTEIEESWQELTINGNTAVDMSASAGVANEYRLTTITTIRGKDFKNVYLCYGASEHFGSIKGRVKMPNGTAMPGKVTVTIERSSPKEINIVNTYAPDGVELIIPEFTQSSLTYEVECDKKGCFELNKLPYFGSGMQYEIQAHCNGAKFEGPSGSPVMTLTLEDKNHEYQDIDFTCNDTQNMSGRILYSGSTIPVRDMQFMVNGTLLRNSKGEPVVTDATGNFSFTVPKVELSVRAFKPGHILSGDGYILGGPNKDQKIFTPEQDYDGLTLTDSTKIRLVGRIVAGDEMGKMPMAFGLTKNNIGDNITLVLQLEGDNTSYIHFNRQNPEETHEAAVFTQKVKKGDKEITTSATAADFQQKRIVVKADNNTGEFCLDLAPAKYKISQIYAQGYNSLYNENEGIQILDLTDSTSNSVHAYEIDGEVITDKYTTEYCASYNRVYHAPVTLTLTPVDGRELAYHGEKSMDVTTLSGKYSFPLAWVDTEEGGVTYAFEYPVFKGGKYYQYRIRAFEEYHYNNVPLGRLTKVYVGGNDVTISNGLVAGSESEVVTLSDEGVDKGTAFYGFLANNTSFNTEDELNLFNLRASVDINGYHYESEPIEAYVTGERDMGVEVMSALESKPKILDIIRDPYGADSYAYRAAGTTYNWSNEYEKEYSEYCDFSVEVGFAIIADIGFGCLSGYTFELPSICVNTNSITKHNIEQHEGECSVTFNEQISTSDDPVEVGAMADVYIGSVSTINMNKYQVISVIDSTTYAYLKHQFDTGVMKLISEGEDMNGNPQYLVITLALSPAEGTQRVFAYSQRHIMSVVIPNLEQQRDACLRLAVDASEAKYRANQTGQTFYYQYTNEKNEQAYAAVFPDNMTVRKDSLNMYITQIKEWEDVIAENERVKYETLNNSPFKAYSIGGAAIEYSEEGSVYYRVKKFDAPTYTVVSGGTGGGDNLDHAELDKIDNDPNKTESKGFGIKSEFSINGGYDKDISNSYGNYQCTIAGSGFSLGANDNGYIDMDVYRVPDETLYDFSDEYKDFYNNINNFENGGDVDGYKLTNGSSLQMNDENAMIHNYVFVQRGGASRNPWIDADSTFYYKPDGVSLPLGARTLKIDNPKIYVENPIINNQPIDEPAVFTVRLSNESEVNETKKTELFKASSVWLHVDESSNPDGAKISVDGMPLRNAMEVYLNPGQTVTKTIEVARGGKPLDYEDICLMLTDDPDYWTIEDDAYLTVHYVPASSPVNLSMPADNWMLNTLSQVDEDGKYYIPVQIDGFSTTQYDNFDHIELQYKKQTESEDQWVNYCSFFADDSLYALASGQKEMIHVPGKISNIRFYGENDPIEMKYDLRAVSFCRLGTGFVSRTSKVVSGTKDTRRPSVFGIPKPADGILDFDDVISLPFTEPIAYNYLDETVNFSVQGYTNNSDADHSSYLYFPSGDNLAMSKVNRIMNYQDLTMEAMVKVEDAGSIVPNTAVFMSVIDSEGISSNPGLALAFGYDFSKDALAGAVGECIYYSEPLKNHGLSLTSAMTHVAMTYSAKDSIVHFFVGDEEMPLNAASRNLKCVCQANGPVKLGYNYKGAIGDVRLWNKVLTKNEIATKYKKALSVNEKNLIGYWPMSETSGNVVEDIAGGADLYLTGVSWQTPVGYSLRTEKKAIELSSKAELAFSRDNTSDYSLMFWFRADDNTSVQNSTLFSAGSDNMAETGMDKMRIAFRNGDLVLISEGNTISFGATAESLVASTWHNIAVTVNHSRNIAALFIDGKMTNEVNAEKLGGIASSYVAFGDNTFSGNFDNISLWDIALPSLYLAKYYNATLTGREAELKINLNFEQDKMNSQGSMYVAFSPYNNVIVPSTGKNAGDVMVDEATVTPDSKMYAPVRTGAGIQNLPFTWKSTDDELLIDIKSLASDINNQHLNLVVRNVEDLNGNTMENAQMWSVYVNRNVLTWKEQSTNIAVKVGCDTSFVASFENKCGRVISYTLESSAPWLKLDNTMGTLQPLGEDAVEISISDGLTPGTYSAIVYLTDEDNLISSFTVNVVVSANFTLPEVTTDPAYVNSMNFIAKVSKRNNSGSWSLDMSKKDVVAAFIDKVCVGKANITVDAANNTSMLYLTVLGKTDLTNEPIEFRLYSQADGQIYDLETGYTKSSTWTAESQTFCNATVVGSEQPLEMRTTLGKVQSISLKKGWNWVSFNVIPTVSSGLNELFLDKDAFTTGDMVTRIGHAPATFQSSGTWDNAFDDVQLTKDNVYQIYVQNSGNMTVKGNAVDENERSITLKFNNSDWADMAYLLDVIQPIRTAMSDFQASSTKAPAGTIIKSHDQFAVAQKDGSWIGSLEYMRPGEGYYVKRNGLRDDVVVKYTNNVVSASKEDFDFETTNYDVNASDYRTSMPVIATFKEGEYQYGDVLLAISGDRIVGYAEVNDKCQLFFLNVNADEGEKIQFANLRGGSVVAKTNKSITYKSSGVIGSLESPYIIDFTACDDQQVYDLKGVKYNNVKSLNLNNGVYIINGKKVMK